MIFNNNNKLCSLCAIFGLLLLQAGCTVIPAPFRSLMVTVDTADIKTPAIRRATFAQMHGGATQDLAVRQQMLTSLAEGLQTESDPLVRETIIESVAQFDSPLVKQILLAGLDDESSLVRVRCCQVLGQGGDPSVIGNLIQALKKEEDIDVRQAAADALGKFKNPAAMRGLIAAIDDRDPALQYTGIQALKSITGRDAGGDISAWRQIAMGEVPTISPQPTTSIAERINNLNPLK